MLNCSKKHAVNHLNTTFSKKLYFHSFVSEFDLLFILFLISLLCAISPFSFFDPSQLIFLPLILSPKHIHFTNTLSLIGGFIFYSHFSRSVICAVQGEKWKNESFKLMCLISVFYVFK